MKKILSIILACALMLPSLVGCSTSAPESSTEPESSVAPASSEQASEETPPAEEVWKPYDENGDPLRTTRDANGENGVVSSANYYSSQVGIDIIEKGGNAVDAAVGVAFALGVVELYNSGIGGGGFMTIRFAETGETLFLDFRETTPMAATPSIWPQENGEYVSPWLGGAPVAVPGEVKGLLYALEEYGTMSREEVMEGAIKLAEEGFPIGPDFKSITGGYFDRYAYQEEGKEVFYKDGLPYEVGDIYKNPKLAETLKLIRDEGEAVFYEGVLAEEIVAAAQADGGLLSMEDMANYEVTVREPVSGTYRGYEIISSPPPSSGGTTLIEILNVLENYDVASMEVNSTEYIHLFSEAFKLGFADSAEYMADTDFVEVPLDELTSKEYAAERSALIDLTAAQDFNPGDTDMSKGGTTQFSIMDKEGNVVSGTKTINSPSGVMVPDRGFMLNNETANFAKGEGKANSIEGGKRSLSSMSPSIVLKDGEPIMAVGSPGGTRIITSTALVISRVIDHGMDIQDAIESPRFYNGFGELRLETRIPQETIDELEAMGHKVVPTYDYDTYFGGVQAVIKLEDGTLRGGADSRRDGKALGY